MTDIAAIALAILEWSSNNIWHIILYGTLIAALTLKTPLLSIAIFVISLSLQLFFKVDTNTALVDSAIFSKLLPFSELFCEKPSEESPPFVTDCKCFLYSFPTRPRQG